MDQSAFPYLMEGRSGSNRVTLRPEVGNPSDEVRSAMARLTDRARQLLVDNTDSRVVSNGRSGYLLSKRSVEDISARFRQNASGSRLRSGASIDGNGVYGSSAASQASVELFMAKALGLDLSQMQRSLQTLQEQQAKLAMDVGSAEVALLPSAAAPGSLLQDAARTDVESFVAKVKNDCILQAREQLHRSQLGIIKDHCYSALKSTWSQYNITMGDNFHSASLDERENGLVRVGRSDFLTEGNAVYPSNVDAFVATRGLSHLLANGTTLASLIMHKILSFATIADFYHPQKWIKHFTSYVTEYSEHPTEELVLLWNTVEQIIDPVQGNGPSNDMLSYVSASRHVLERKALSSLLVNMLKIDASRIDELENMCGTRVLSVIERYCLGGSGWSYIYTAMRCGRYDVAVLAAKEMGIAAVETALQECADCPTSKRNTLFPSCSADLRALYAEPSTREDPHRWLVLFLLLAAGTGEPSDVIQRTIVELSGKVATSLEETLWIRLFSIRTLEDVKGEKVRSLAFMQQILLDDLQELVRITQGNKIRLVSFLIHALLPCAGLRMLIDDDATYVDGLHLTLCLSNADMLHCSPVESPIDLPRHLAQYCSLLILDADKKYRLSSQVGTSVFSYFSKTGYGTQFVEYCQNEVVNARLFGMKGGNGCDGVLVQHYSSRSRPNVPEKLSKAMSRIAEVAVERANATLAVHMFIVISELNIKAETQANSASPGATSVVREDAADSDNACAKNTLRRAVQVISPVVAQGFFEKDLASSSHFNLLFSQLSRLHHIISQYMDASRKNICPLKPHEAANFEALYIMATMCRQVEMRNDEQGLQHFFNLPFVPVTSYEVDKCVELFCSADSAVVTAIGPIVGMAFRSALQLIEKYKNEGRIQAAMELRRQMDSVCVWAKRCQERVVFSDISESVTAFENVFPH